MLNEHIDGNITYPLQGVMPVCQFTVFSILLNHIYSEQYINILR